MSDGGAGSRFRLAVIAVVAVDPIDIQCAGERWGRQHDQSYENRDNAAIQHGDSLQQKSAWTIVHDLFLVAASPTPRDFRTFALHPKIGASSMGGPFAVRSVSLRPHIKSSQHKC